MSRPNDGPTRWCVGAFTREQAWGGPEEGGWWYYTGEFVRALAEFPTRAEAHAYAARWRNLASAGDYTAAVYPDALPAFYPAQRPHYE